MFMDAAINPSPSVNRRVLRIGHICASIEAPFRARLGAYFPTAAEKGPDGLRTT